MTINPFAPELAAEHRRDLLHSAVAYRQSKVTRPTRRPRASTRMVRIRPIRREDATLLALRDFTDVDHHDHAELLAVTRLRGKPVGVARFVRLPSDPASAEVAVEVVDGWQNRGVGSMLAARLTARARCEGVAHFTAVMSAGNTHARRLLTELGNAVVVARSGNTVSYRVELPAPAPASRLRRARASAGCA